MQFISLLTSLDAMLKKRVGKRRTWVTQGTPSGDGSAAVVSAGDRLQKARRNALQTRGSPSDASSGSAAGRGVALFHGAQTGLTGVSLCLRSPGINSNATAGGAETEKKRYSWCLNAECVATSVVPIARGNDAAALLAHQVAHHPTVFHDGPHPTPHLSEDEVANGTVHAQLLVAAAWREERRDPAVAVCLAAEAAEAAAAAVAAANGEGAAVQVAAQHVPDCSHLQQQRQRQQRVHDEQQHAAKHIIRRSFFLFGKLMVEAFVEFDKGALLLSRSLGTSVPPSAAPTPTTTHTPAEQRKLVDEELGIAFHLTRAYYDNYRYAEAWDVLAKWTRNHFPEAWAGASWGDGGAGDGGDREDGTEGAAARDQPNQPSTEPSKYHRAMLLHACVVAAVHQPSAAGAISACIAGWIEAHRDVMWRQFNAEIRFATVIQRLLPMAPGPPAAADGPTTSSAAPCPAVYTLGESHTLPLVWQTLHLGGDLGSRQVLPRLVIGLKAWHFNPALTLCRERGILLAHAASIPPRSTIIICAGEIDLREAGAIAMLPQHWGEHRPKKYSSSSAAIKVTVDAFFGGLRALRDAGEQHRLLLHPVRPPPAGHHAPECHGLIVAWNNAVAAACEEADNAGITQLDFFDKLCAEPSDNPLADAEAEAEATQSGGFPALRPDFHIGDGFHLNRLYLPLVAASVARSLRHDVAAAQ